ncbi:MAG: hypothetical protein MUC65_04145 [Pontiellaceae bacterium]|jgi:hypothetical protein|nr:hypothetical protein [Pontiellaceae bacterium]
MKQILFYTLAAGLALSTGCSKKEEPAAQTVPPKETVSKPPQAAPETPAKTTQTAGKQITEKTAALKEQATAAGAETIQKVKSATTVTADDVMADLKLSPDEVKAKASGYNQSEVIAYANGYKEVIREKTAQMNSLADTVKGLKATEIFGEKGKGLQSKISEYTVMLTSLKERYSVYLDLLKKYGVDLSAYGL